MGNSNNKHEKLIEKIKEFCLFDDELMSCVFDKNIECTELILRIILDKPDIRVKEVYTQSEIKNLFGHSVRLGIDAVDTDNEPVNVEIQRAEKGADVKHARYNSSLLDANTLVKGEDYDKLPESYVIFITETDVMRGGLPVYHAENIITETGKPLGDGRHIIYVNGAYRDDSPIGKLMHDFSCKTASDMNYKELSNSVRYYKESDEGVKSMSRIIEELIEREKKEEKIEMIIKMKETKKITNEDIATITGYTVEEVEAVEAPEMQIAY